MWSINFGRSKQDISHLIKLLNHALKFQLNTKQGLIHDAWYDVYWNEMHARTYGIPSTISNFIFILFPLKKHKTPVTVLTCILRQNVRLQLENAAATMSVLQTRNVVPILAIFGVLAPKHWTLKSVSKYEICWRCTYDENDCNGSRLYTRRLCRWLQFSSNCIPLEKEKYLLAR